jgi:predicted dehydrogenase
MSSLTRRSFLSKSAALTAAALAGPTLLLRGQDFASKRLNIAVIGALGKGQSDTNNVSGDHNIVALVDVDSTRLGQAVANLEKSAKNSSRPASAPPKLYADFRKMFDELDKQIDAVIVSTPDHTHFAAAMAAIKHKKHVAVQKPLCNYIAEARALHKAAREAGVVTQMGNQGRTMEGQRLAKEWIEQGAIGTLQEVRLWTNRPIWPQGPLTKKPAAAPSNLAWDLWLGVEPSEPYFEFETPAETQNKRGSNSVHPFAWRGWWQFGSGALGDMGCHIMDATFSILGQRIPVKIDVQSSPLTDLQAPLWTQLRYHFAKSDKFPALTVSWHDGLKDGKPNKPERDPRVPEETFNRATSGMMFIGSEGIVYEGDAYCRAPQIFPAERAEEVKKATAAGTIKQTEPRSTHPGNPQLEWASAILAGTRPSSNFDYAAPLAEFVLLGNLALRSGQTIQWDAQKMQVTNVPAANQFVKRPSYREGWL